MRVRTDIVVPEGLQLLGTEMIEEQERPYGLAFRGGKKPANLGLAHLPHSRLQYKDVSHFSFPLLKATFRAQALADFPDSCFASVERTPARMHGVGAEHEVVGMLDG